LIPGSRILDVGCGAGASVEYLIDGFQLDAVGIDPSETMLTLGLARNARLPIIPGRAENMPFSDRSMDAVISECSLSQVSHAGRALEEIDRVLRDDGWLIVSDIYARQQGLRPSRAQMPGETTGFMEREAILDQIKRSGFAVRLWEDHTDQLMQLMFDIVMKYGCMENFWAQVPGAAGCQLAGAAKQGAKLGYYLMAARKDCVLDLPTEKQGDCNDRC
jgi:SAM-dependent methyltransferase